MKLSWRGVNILLLCGQAMLFATEGHVAAFTPLLLREMGLSDAEVAVWVGVLFAVMMAVAFSLAPFWGVLAERFSRRWVVLRSFYFLAAALLVNAWATDVSHLLVARVLMGLCFGTGGLVVGIQALLTPHDRLGQAIATVQAAMPIAASIGPPLGAQAIPLLGLRGLFVVDAGLMVLTAGVLTVLLPDPSERVKKGSVLGRTREVLGLVWTMEVVRWNFVSALFQRGSQSIVESYLPVRIIQLAESSAQATATIGWTLGIYGGLTAILTWLVGRIVDRVDVMRLYWKMMLLATGLAIGLALAPTLWTLAGIAILRSVPIAFSNTLLLAHLARNIPRDLSTAIFSLSPMPRNLGALTLPLVAAAVAPLAPGAALAVSAVGYGCNALAGLALSRLSASRRRGDGASTRNPLDSRGR